VAVSDAKRQASLPVKVEFVAPGSGVPVAARRRRRVRTAVGLVGAKPAGHSSLEYCTALSDAATNRRVGHGPGCTLSRADPGQRLLAAIGLGDHAPISSNGGKASRERLAGHPDRYRRLEACFHSRFAGRCLSAILRIVQPGAIAILDGK
jgi:hypothetical protein